jgi:hypothetical protein
MTQPIQTSEYANPRRPLTPLYGRQPRPAPQRPQPPGKWDFLPRTGLEVHLSAPAKGGEERVGTIQNVSMLNGRITVLCPDNRVEYAEFGDRRVCLLDRAPRAQSCAASAPGSIRSASERPRSAPLGQRFGREVDASMSLERPQARRGIHHAGRGARAQSARPARLRPAPEGIETDPRYYNYRSFTSVALDGYPRYQKTHFGPIFGRIAPADMVKRNPVTIGRSY